MKPAIIVVDMLRDSLPHNGKGDGEGEKIIAPMREFLGQCRKASVPIIFAMDSFLPGDFIFKGRMKPHALRGTEGAEVIPELEPCERDYLLPKRRFSAFFKTDLDQTLRTIGVDTVAVCGINTHFCVLATVFDAVCHDFYTIILDDLSASFKREIHESFVNTYRFSAIHPLLQVMASVEFLKSLAP